MSNEKWYLVVICVFLIIIRSGFLSRIFYLLAFSLLWNSCSSLVCVCVFVYEYIYIFYWNTYLFFISFKSFIRDINLIFYLCGKISPQLPFVIWLNYVSVIKLLKLNACFFLPCFLFLDLLKKLSLMLRL